MEYRLGWGRRLLALLFLLAILFTSRIAFPGITDHSILLIAAVLGGYMALNIGANDAGNNIGPLVGSRVISLLGAVLFAAMFEAAGAILAGTEVISTIKQGIVSPDQLGGSEVVIRVMLSALLAAALWLNIATATGTPVSTTHSIVGGVMGAGITVGGLAVANWKMLGAITIGWVLSPLLGGLIAALLLYLIKRTLLYQKTLSQAAKKVLPLLVGFMAWTFTTYLLLKGLKVSWRVDFPTALLCGFTIGLGVYLITYPIIEQRALLLTDSKTSLNRLFNLPLLMAAGLLSFAHGSNDIANVIGPMIAIKEAIQFEPLMPHTDLTLWLLLIGALGIPLGLMLFGRRLIRTIGSEITELDQVRTFCVTTSVATTVLLASQLGMPVSSTHTAVGAIFGIGFLREALKTNYAILLEQLRRYHENQTPEEIDAFIQRFDKASFSEKGQMLDALDSSDMQVAINKKERKSLQKLYRHALVERSTFIRILFAWFITLPITGLLASIIYRLSGWFF
ncbi:MAG: inorganic phosphate transporter [Candidatus Thiodiazotropha sp. (ex Monitilora ramsayi)]|nr:inorganic phosphate transporter [Candidatus Thiodiazotropha sp. (ex Monitilora ramsayi)]